MEIAQDRDGKRLVLPTYYYKIRGDRVEITQKSNNIRQLRHDNPQPYPPAYPKNYVDPFYEATVISG